MTNQPTQTTLRIAARIADQIGAQCQQVLAAIELLDQGATVPFIARYRKEATGGLDDSQLRDLQESLIYGREIEDRRLVILESIQTQGKLTDALRNAIQTAETKQRLEDLYLPYKPKRRTRAQIAKEAGLEPLAQLLLENPRLDPETCALDYVSEERGVKDTKTALDGARDILAERFAENADLLTELREYLYANGYLVSQVIAEKHNDAEAAKYKDYFDYRETLEKVPSHRALAVFRGRQEGILTVKIQLSEELESLPTHPCQERIADYWNCRPLGRPADQWLSGVVRWTWRVKCLTRLETELFSRVRDRAQDEAIGVFGTNLKDLLLAAPAGRKVVMGLDPGIRTGVKVAVISDTGAVLETGVVFPHEPRRQWDESIETLAVWIRKHGSKLVAIGNGTASRETDRLVGDLMRRYPELGVMKVVVSEAGASVYSASAVAAAELPSLDVSYRGAVSIARRLQDPLAELVKIDPKAIGVGQYQHDVNQIDLARKLDAVVEDCVNAVGVDLNTASSALLAKVAGVTDAQATAIVRYRDDNGAFACRNDLLNVPRLGSKTFEQAAGFLRIPQGSNPLDASAVHPESYFVVERIVKRTGKSVQELIGNQSVLSRLNPQDFADEGVGLPTVRDILSELEKPGRDPRPEFKMARFEEAVQSIADLRVGMKLEGVVSNVAAFGAFVDIGVHQDGLVHVSELADRFVRDPRDVVKVGDIVRVRVVDVDVDRKRIGLSLRSESGHCLAEQTKKQARGYRATAPRVDRVGALANALAGAFKRRS